jgi:hypothetical protein
MYRDLLGLPRKSLFYSSLRKSSLPQLLFQIARRSSFSSLSFRSFELGDIPRKRQQGAHSSLERKVFFLLSFASGPSQADQFLLIYSSFGYGTSVPTPQ